LGFTSVTGRRRTLAVGLAAVVVAAVLVAVTTRLGSSPSRSSELSSYTVLYQVQINNVPSWEILRAHRPGSGSDLTYRGSSRPTEGTQPSGGSISTLTGLYTANAGEVLAVSGRQPGAATNDLFLAAERSDLIDRGLAADLHRTDRIAGRSCSLLRLKAPVSGPIAPLSSDGDHDDICLDGSGLVMSETWTLRGQVVLVRTATQVWTGAASVAAGLPAVPSVEAASPASAAAATVTLATAPSKDLLSPMAPSGYSVLLPAQAFRLPDSGSPGGVVATSLVWSFARGPAVITVEAGRGRSGALPWHRGDTLTKPVHLSVLGDAVSALRSDGPEIRVVLANGDWVRVRGTVPLPELTAFADRLRPAPSQAGTY
jgi:hypothetical protein